MVAEIDMIASLIKRLVPSLANFLKRSIVELCLTHKKVTYTSTPVLLPDYITLYPKFLFIFWKKHPRISRTNQKTIVLITLTFDFSSFLHPLPLMFRCSASQNRHQLDDASFAEFRVQIVSV